MATHPHTYTRYTLTKHRAPPLNSHSGTFCVIASHPTATQEYQRQEASHVFKTYKMRPHSTFWTWTILNSPCLSVYLPMALTFLLMNPLPKRTMCPIVLFEL